MKNPQISNFTKIRPVVAELSHADGQTSMTKVIVAFHNLANEAKNDTSDYLIFTTYMLYVQYSYRVNLKCG